jgi:hypothetical protein
MRTQSHSLGAGKGTATAQIVIEKEAEPEQCPGPQASGVGQHERQRLNDGGEAGWPCRRALPVLARSGGSP